MPTLEEAKLLWCPFAKSVDTEDYSGPTSNRAWQGEAKSNCRCLADECMAWRWSAPEGHRVFHGALWKLDTLSGKWEPVSGWTPEGYCGLAGRV